MLGLGSYISNSDASGRTPGAFYLKHTLNSDADRLRILATEINHAGDTDTEDTAPGVKIKNLVFKVNGTTVSTFDLDSAHADDGSTAIYDDVTVVNSTTLTFSDTSYLGVYDSAIINLYDHISDKGIDAGDTIEVSGIVTLNDGTDNIYVDAVLQVIVLSVSFCVFFQEALSLSPKLH